MRYYVLHYPKQPERKIALLKQFEEYNIENVTWVEDLNKDDPFIAWVKEKTKSNMPLGHVSANVKHYKILYDMVQNDIDEAIIFEDDVVFDPEFRKLNFDIFPRELGFLRLGIGVHLKYSEKMYSAENFVTITNPGGCECYWMTKRFAKLFIEYANFDFSMDMVQMGFMGTVINKPMKLLPVCYQTSIFNSETSETGTCSDVHWMDYCSKFLELENYSFPSLWKEYHTPVEPKPDSPRSVCSTYGVSSTSATV